MLSAPALEKGCRARFDIDSIGCQNIRDDFNLVRVAQHDKWSASLDHPFALLDDSQHPSCDRGTKGDYFALRSAVPDAKESRSGHFHLGRYSQGIEFRGLQLLGTGDLCIPCLLECLRRDDLISCKLFGPFPVSPALLVVLACMFCSGVRLVPGGLRARDTPQHFLSLLLIQRKRLDQGYNLAFTDSISLFQLDAQHPARDRGGDNESIMRPRFTILIHGHAQRTASCFRGLDEDRSRTQHDPNQRSDTKRKCGYYNFSTPSTLCHVTPLSSARPPGPFGSGDDRAEARWPPTRGPQSERKSHKSSH